MDTGHLLSVIDEVTAAGCLDILITGGEPLLRKDFSDIYRHIKLNGILVSVFTNGTLITDDVAALFKELPPQSVEISVYGATAATYERITGVTSSFEKCLAGITTLLEHNIAVRLKTILMTLNRHEFHAMENLARSLGVKFRFDPAIFPCFDGDQSPLTLRVPPEEAVAFEFADDDRSRDWKDFYAGYSDTSSLETVYYCGAGVTDFYIDPNGILQPCLMPTELGFDLREGGFLEGWNMVIPRLMEKKPASDHACRACSNRILCGYCPAFFRLENNSENAPSAYLCALGRSRFQMIQEIP